MSPTDLTTLRQIEAYHGHRADLFMLAYVSGVRVSETLQLANVSRHWQQVLGSVIAAHECCGPVETGTDASIESDVAEQLRRDPTLWELPMPKTDAMQSAA